MYAMNKYIVKNVAAKQIFSYNMVALDLDFV